MSEWKTVDSAPKDGTWIIGLWFYAGNPVYRLVAFDDRDFMQSWHQKPSNNIAYVEYWMNLPEPPIGEESCK